MLIEFSVENFLSFKERVTFSMLPYNGYKNTDGETNTSPTKGGRTKRLLDTAVIYGANASGKTNLIKAMTFFKNLVAGTYKPDFINHKLKPFGFSNTAKTEATSFEIKFFVGATIYTYEIDMIDGAITFEELFAVVDQPKRRNRLIFSREGESIKFGSGFSEKKLFAMTRPDRPFLNMLYEFNNPVAEEPMEWLGYNFHPISDESSSERLMAFTIDEHRRNESGFRQKINCFVKTADVWLERISISEPLVGVDPKQINDMDSSPGKKEMRQPQFVHFAENEKGKKLSLTIAMEDESAGLKKMFAFAGPILDTLQYGNTLIIDEMTSKMHPLLAKEIIRMFHNPESNRHGAQLIFNTHDTTFLNPELMRRDQVWFTEKQSDGSSELFSLVEFNARNEDPFANRYLHGAFGAIPSVDSNDLANIFKRK